MRQVVQNRLNGRLEVVESPKPAVQARGVLVRTAYSLISTGTERAKVNLSRMSLIQKARARPDQTQKLLLSARSEGVAATYRKAVNRLARLEALGYSCSGIVCALGDGVHNFEVGDQVA